MKQRKKYFSAIFIPISFALLLTVFGISLTSCDEAAIGQIPVDSESPSVLTNIQIEELPGGAKISYDLPNESDISYVICEYEFKGKNEVVRTSVYSNELIVEGLGEIAPCDFTLYLVDHSENRSKPFSGSFTPLEPPHKTISKTITMEPDFGGVVIRWNNETNALIGAFLFAVDDNGEWEEKDLIFSTLTNEQVAIRGYNTDERRFGISLIDRFGNQSDTIIATATPLFEKLLDKSKFKDGHLMGDNYTGHTNGRVIERLWDGDINFMWHTSPTAGFSPPQTFTIDLGALAQLSRMRLWNRQGEFFFSQHNPRLFEVWGTTALSHNINDSYWEGEDWKDEWILLGDFEQIKPSGLPNGQNTDEDYAATISGSEHIFNAGAGEIRYLRFVVKETWQRTSALHIAEVSIYGDDGVREEDEE